jgi:predicted RNA-binding Zn ribbon-like protein
MQRIDPETRKLLGGVTCLDFANSVDWASDGGERPDHADVLTAPAHLAAWGVRLGIAAPGVTLRVTGRELSAARTVRRAMHGVFAAIAAGGSPDPDALGRIAHDYREAAAAADLAERDGRWQLGWRDEDPRRVRFAAVVSAVDLLRDEPRLLRVRMCPGNNCGWLFLDGSGRRQWCSMEVCGSRAKMRRRYERQRQARAGADTREAV